MSRMLAVGPSLTLRLSEKDSRKTSLLQLIRAIEVSLIIELNVSLFGSFVVLFWRAVSVGAGCRL